MAGKWIANRVTASAAILLLLGVSSIEQVNGTYQTQRVGNFQNVVRIELEKHFIPHQEIEELEEMDEENDDIHIELVEDNYVQLRQ